MTCRKTFLTICLLLQAPLIHAADLHEVDLLVQSGASTLALDVIDREQPALQINPEQWLDWERQRITLYTKNKDWRALIKRLRVLPDWVPIEFYNWSLEQIARAQIELKKTDAALTTLRKLIWVQQLGKKEHAEDRLPVWRQLVIKAYLVADNILDAEAAMLRFQQDYGNPDGAWKRLRATVLIRAGKPYDAQLLMEKESHMYSRTILYLAQLLHGKVKAKKIYNRTLKLGRKKKFSKKTRRQFWTIASRAAVLRGNYPAAINAMQQALLLLKEKEQLSQQEKLLFPVSGQQLWALYETYGKALANSSQLLIGNDEAWFSRANKLVSKKPLQAMALSAALAALTNRDSTRLSAHDLFASLLNKNKKQGLKLLSRLYVDAEHVDKVAYLPEELRHLMIDRALSLSDVGTASRLISSVNAPPKGADVLFWKMRRARILILAGELDKGINALREILKNVEELESKPMDRIMQVLFDLQTVGRHKEAIELFSKLPLKGHPGQIRREVLYWIADSYKEQKEYLQAARFYLNSAGLLDSKAMDPWGQTARYHAADMLLEAGSYKDSGTIYRRLLAITKEPGRKVVLKNKIQQIWLQSNQKSEETSLVVSH